MMTKTKKTSLLAMLLLMVTCTVAWAIDFSAGNYIPKGSSSAQNSAGAIIVTSLAETVGNADLSTDGGSPLHYLLAIVGDTDVRYSSSTTATDTKRYNKNMIAAIVTCNETGSIGTSVNFLYAFKSGNYVVPYRAVFVKVSNFSASHNSYSTNISDWYGDSTNTYEVVNVTDVFSAATAVAQLSLGPHECIHVVMVPFAYSNETYFLDVQPGNGTSVTRFEFSGTCQYGQNGSSSGDVSDAMNVNGTVDQDLTKNRTTLDLAFDTQTKAMSVSELFANSQGCQNMAATLNMAYNNTLTSRSTSVATEDLFVTLSPYPLGSSSYRFTSGTTDDTLEMGFKLTNFKSASSSVYLVNNSNQVLSSSDIVDTADYLNPKLKVVTKQTSRSQSGSSWSRTYTYVFDGSLSFDVYPYIQTSSPSLKAGQYSSSIVVEFTKD